MIPFFSTLQNCQLKETIMEIKTFVEVANNVNKVGKGGGGGGGGVVLIL